MRFRDRAEAGERLALRLHELTLDDPVVLGLPRGGMVVAAPVARALGTWPDAFVARKIGAPGNPELAIGAVAEGGTAVFDDESVAAFGLDDGRLAVMAREAEVEMARRVARYRGGRSIPPLRGRDVLVVDDGLATGLTARAALSALRRAEPRRLVFAVPVGAADSIRSIGELAEVICLEVPPRFGAVGSFYEDFAQVTDGEVIELLEATGPTT